MSLNLIKSRGKTLFCNNKLDIKSILPKEDYTDVIPYSFGEIDKIVGKKQKIYPKRTIEEHTKDQFMRKFINKVRFMIKTEEGTKIQSSIEGYKHAQIYQEINTEKWKTDTEMYKKMYKALPSMSKDNLIRILSISTPAYFYTKSRFWFRMSRVTLRYILAHKENLSTGDIVKIFNCLREWKFESVRDLQNRFDLIIPMYNTWNLDESSQLLLCLHFLNMERSRSFEFLSEVIMLKLNLEQNLHIERNFTKIIYRIARISVKRLERYGTCDRVVNSLQSYFRGNPVSLKCLNTKTLFKLTELVPHWQYEEELTHKVVSAMLQQFSNFTLEEGIRCVFNVALLDSKLSDNLEKEVIKFFYRFREAYLSSKEIMSPQNVAKLIYTLTHLVKSPDNELILKCLWDLKVNMKEMGLMEITGNMLCFNYLLNQFSERMDNMVKENVRETVNEIVEMVNSSESLITEDGVKGVNLNKIWTMPVLNHFKVNCDVVNEFREFYENLEKIDDRLAMRTLLLFISVTFGNREIMETNFKNLIILTCAKLYSKLEGKGCSSLKQDKEMLQYWGIIKCYLSIFKMEDAFRREVNLKEDLVTEDVTSNLVNMLKLIVEGRNFEEMKDCLRELAKEEGRDLGNEEKILIRLMVMNNIKEGVEVSELIRDFYGPKINIVKLGKNEDKIERYVNRCLSMSCTPIRTDLVYTKLFFNHCNPRNLVELIPGIIVGEMLEVKRSRSELKEIGNWLKLEKKWRSLWKYTRNKKEGKKEIKKEEIEEPKLVYINGKLKEMEINYVLEDFYVGPWKCPYVAKNIETNQTLLIFPFDNRLNEEKHGFDEIRRDVLKKLGYNFIELYYQLPHKP